MAAAQRELGSFEASFSTLSLALENHPSNVALLLALVSSEQQLCVCAVAATPLRACCLPVLPAQANECMFAEQFDLAAKLTRRAIRQNRSLRPAWLLLARCCAC